METNEITSSILNSVKKMLGYPPEMTAFDPDLIININAAIGILTQIGIGPKSGFIITGPEETYEDFLDSETDNLKMVCMYIYLKTKLGFDPPSTSSVQETMREMIREYEFRLSIHK